MNPARRRTTSAAATAVVLATTGGLLTALAAPASAAVSCTSPVYKREFFANTTFSGTPKKTDCDSTISQNWGTGAPASGLPTNNFSVRWTVTRDFGSGGPFALTASTQDGIRVYLDGTRKIDLWKNVSSTVSTTVNLTIPSGKHTLRVDYVNWTGTANVKFAYAPRTSATVDKVKPLTPTGTAVSYDTVTGKAKLSWSKNKEMDLAGYRVYRRSKGSTAWTRLATTTATSYTDATLPVTGAAYYYEIRAYDKAGNESTGTADQLVTTVDRTAPAVPTGLSTASEPTDLRIRWKAVEGAASYRVYRAAGADGTYTRVGSTDQVSYADTSAAEDATYYYRVTALDAAGNESARSAAVSGKRRDLTPPSAVTGVTVTPTEYGFEVRWDANPTPDLASYAVRRGELWGDEEEQVCSLYPGYHVSADTTSYAYVTVPDGEESCFIVDAIDDAGNSSFQWTGEAQIVTATELDLTPSVATPEGSPVGLTATSSEAGVELSWSPVTDATGYQVYRWNPDAKAYEKLAATTGTSYEDTGAAKGTTHYYWVTALYADGTESAPGADWVSLAP
ncbi:cellulose 1,4-beta-cellobiosidase [Streptomyces sp. KM273126]|uniref:fibronectin type III domain-containing protein n=1 Tax=Streptomyces sp. KM273126 TaxID=2545247 RepID=UPI00103988F8|nr:PA14 domain-containing protein [Streptomyces sp. KM273126]MBA2808362.1 cellulose 1,4-beta-cellobiosidase [Streptomyces sp. KM273126]